MRFVYALALLVPGVCLAQTTRVGDWNVVRAVRPDDSADVTVRSATGTPEVRLSVFCSDAGPSVALSHAILGGDARQTVRFTYRIDSEPAVGPSVARLGGGRRNTFPFALDEGRADVFLTGARAGGQVEVRIEDPQDHRVLTSTVSLHGFAEAVDVLECLRPVAGGLRSGDILEFSEVQPTLVGGIERLQQSIQYPDFELRNGIEGRVIVSFVVDEDGVPWDVSVARGVSLGLDGAAVEAVRAARFTPGEQNGRPVAVRFTLPVTCRTGAQGDGVPATPSGYP